MKRSAFHGFGEPWIPEQIVANAWLLLLVGRNWIDPGSVRRGAEENQHWDGAHHRATSSFSGRANNWPWCQHSQCCSHPPEEVRVDSSGLCWNFFAISLFKKGMLLWLSSYNVCGMCLFFFLKARLADSEVVVNSLSGSCPKLFEVDGNLSTASIGLEPKKQM